MVLTEISLRPHKTLGRPCNYQSIVTDHVHQSSEDIFTPMASTVAGSQFNTATLGFGETGYLHHGRAADNSSGTVRS